MFTVIVLSRLVINNWHIWSKYKKLSNSKRFLSCSILLPSYRNSHFSLFSLWTHLQYAACICSDLLVVAVPLFNWRWHCLPMIMTMAADSNELNLSSKATVEQLWVAHTHAHTHPSWKVTPVYFDCIWLLSSPLMRLSASQPHTQLFSYDFTYWLGKISPLYTMSAKSGVPSSCFGHRRLKDV